MLLLICCVCLCVCVVGVKVRFAHFGSLTSVASIDILHQPISVEWPSVLHCTIPE